MLTRLLGIVGWLGTALVFGALAVRFLRPEWQQYASWAAWAGLACVLLYTLGQWRDIARLFQRRQARYGTVAGAGVIVVLGILVGINYLASRQNKRWDLTASQAFSLSDQTRRILAELQEPVKIMVFSRENDFERFRDRLREYEYLSRQISVEYVDADRRPALVRQYEVQSYGTVVFEYQGRIERLTSDAEQDLTNALIKVTTGAQKKVYFVQGHGEKDTAAVDRAGYSTITAGLGRDNFTVEKLVLAQQGSIPEDTTVIVIAGPTIDYLPGEIEAIRQYLQRGGKLLCLLDPPDDTTKQTPSINEVVQEWGFQLGNDIVVDVSGIGRLVGTDPSVPIAAQYPPHPITERMNTLTAYPLARSVTGATTGDRTPRQFVETSQNSWAETDIAKLLATGEVQMEEAQGDRPGPIPIAAAVSVESTEPAPAGNESAAEKPAGPDAPEGQENAASRRLETRVIVVGDSDFASNAGVSIGGNSDMFLNMVNWLAEQENLISIRPRQPEERRLTLTAEQQGRIVWLSLLVVPGLILGTGVYTWWQRR